MLAVIMAGPKLFAWIAAVSVVPCLSQGAPASSGSMTCDVQGDPHLTTFDNAKIDLYDDCRYILAAMGLGDCMFRVDMKNQLNLSSPQPNKAYTQFLEVTYPGEVIRLDQGKRVKVNGKELPALPSHTRLSTITMAPLVTPTPTTTTRTTSGGGFVTVTTKACNVTVQFDGSKHVRVVVPSSMSGELYGLCGNGDHRKEDDLVVMGMSVDKFPTLQEGYRTLVRDYVVFDMEDGPTMSKCGVPVDDV